MKKMVLIPFTLWGIPCANLPISLPNKCIQNSFYFGLLTRCLYSNNSPVSPSRIATANLHNTCSGNFLFVDCVVCITLFSQISNIHSCMMVVCCFFDLVLETMPIGGVCWVKGVIGLGPWVVLLLSETTINWGVWDVGACGWALRCSWNCLG